MTWYKFLNLPLKSFWSLLCIQTWQNTYSKMWGSRIANTPNIKVPKPIVLFNIEYKTMLHASQLCSFYLIFSSGILRYTFHSINLNWTILKQPSLEYPSNQHQRISQEILEWSTKKIALVSRKSVHGHLVWSREIWGGGRICE